MMTNQVIQVIISFKVNIELVLVDMLTEDISTIYFCI